jgi:pantetheine-phosphate adenylyltransferase
MPSSRIAIFPGSFDPLTNGHVDLIRRAARLFDRVVVAVLINPEKKSLFTVEERVAMISEACLVLPESDQVVADSFAGLLVHYAANKGACAIIRGLRSGGDLDYEKPMASMNAHLAPGIDTVFLAASNRYAHISSTLVREVASYGVSVEKLVPPLIASRLAVHFASARGARS